MEQRHELAVESFSVPEDEICARIKGLQKRLLEKDCQAALIIEKTDLYYFSGTSQQGWLYVPAKGRALLLIFKDFERAQKESALNDIVEIASPKKLCEEICSYGFAIPKNLGMELDVLPASLYFLYKKIFQETEIVDFSYDIRLLRAVKSSYEVSKMQEAAELADAVAEYASTRIVSGKPEVVLAGEVEAFARGLGHQGLIRMRMFNNELYYGHILSGSGAAVPSYLASPTGGQGVSTVIGQGAGYRKITENDVVLVDYVFALDGYLADHARLFSLGEPNPHLEKAHQAMLEIEQWTKKNAKPGVVTGELYDEMVAMAEAMGYGEHFMGVGDKRIRFTGHGVGLELDEFPFIAQGQKIPLEKGMVFALEPKTVFPGLGIAGIENTHLVGEEGLEPLTHYHDGIVDVT